MKDYTELTGESRNGIGQTVWLVFGSIGKIGPCVISRITYTDYGKVLYNVKLWPFPDEKNNEIDNTKIFTELHDVDSYFVKTEADLLLYQ